MATDPQRPDISAKRLSSKEYDGLFCDKTPPLNLKTAQVEASRCYYCYDAPCIRACPTEIDIPSFIRKIGNGNIRGAAVDILSSNVMGGTCARVCPVETLCQQACVRESSESKPVAIGQLQRFATDEFFKTGEQIFKRAPSNGRKVAVIGAGPAGLSCAHRLATLGYAVTIFEGREKSGGLNEYGLAPYKVTDGFVQKEVDYILGVGGIEVKNGMYLGRDITLEQLKKDYQAVFLGIGLSDVNSLGIPGEELPGVLDAAKFIETIRQSKDLSLLPVGRNVVVIGGGNTAVDISIQMKKLGAEFVTMVYRRGEEQMGATVEERRLAQKNGVLIKTWAKPSRIEGDSRGASEIELEYTRLDPQGKLVGSGRFFKLKADQVFKAIGQTLKARELEKTTGLKILGGKIAVNDDFETNLPGVYAGGDCIAKGVDLTVTSVQHGKLAALAMHRKLEGRNDG